ncbi:MAG: glycosyltransferase family 4 protein [Clostridia bacterium]|nr:glycosyltransferase family 4 protein [Clostridia bacterium]
MDILVISQYYYPEQFLINEIAPELVNKGHNITVLTGLPNYPEGKVLSDYKFGKNREEELDGVHIIRCTEVGRHKGPMWLMLNYITYPFFATIKLKKIKKKFDVILCYQLSPVIMALPAVKYRKKNKIPLLLYCLDIWPESAQAHIRNDKGFLYKLISKISKSIYKSCDLIAVTSEPFIEYMNGVNDISREKLVYIPQHAGDSLLNMDLTAENTQKVNFMYAGNMGAGQTVDVIVNAVAALKDRDDFLLHLVGDGSRLDELKKLASEKGIEDKVIFHGRHKMSEMADFYKTADVLVITLRGNNFVGNTLPGKLQTYMTTGKPIIGAINGAAKDVIETSGCGACVASGDYNGLARLMADVIENPEKYDKCGENARQYFRGNFTKQVFVERLDNQLKELVKVYKD